MSVDVPLRTAPMRDALTVDQPRRPLAPSRTGAAHLV